MQWSRPAMLLATALAVVAALAVACADDGGDSEQTTEAAGEGQTASPPASTGTPAAASPTAREINPVMVNSVLSVGPNRIAMGFFDAEGNLLSDLQVAAAVWPGEEDQPPTDAPRTEMTPRTMGAEDHHADSAVSGVTVYTAEVEFPQPGTWSMRIEIRRGDEMLDRINATFNVVEDPPHPQPGERIPATEQRVLRDVEELGQIDTSPEPDPELHEQTVAEALESGRPMVVAFTTPAFCETRLCGPVMEETIHPLSEDYGDRVQFIHIEPYEIEQARNGELVPVPAMAEWGLATEPWVFVVDGDGRVVAKFEGVVTRDEVEPLLQDLTASALSIPRRERGR